MGARTALLFFILGLLLAHSEVSARKGSSSSRSSPRNVKACNGTQTFQCDKDRCIPRSWRCDGDIDCKNGEDEQGCEKTCSQLEFQCVGEQSQPEFKRPHYYPCIPIDWRCDGEYDCDDKSDEKDCSDVVCNKDQFACNEFDGSYKLCIPKSWHCDGQKDCASGADEENCEKKTCEKTDFACDNGICIFNHWRCDGEDDCGDNSDEKNCTETAEQICEGKKMFKCKLADGCIPHDWVCDGEADCLDHSDERNCTQQPFTCKKPATEFACASGHHCINKMWMCDGEEDCSDGSDESPSLCGDARECLKDEFKCQNGRCIGGNMVCDGREDCVGGEDEERCPGNDTTVQCDPYKDYDCSDSKSDKHLCVPLKNMCKDSKHNCGTDDDVCTNNILRCQPNSNNCECHNSYFKRNETKKVCYCREGYRPSVNGATAICEDINECEEDGTCDQNCHNTDGGYVCSCRHGYKLSHGPDAKVPNRCRAMGGDPLVLLSNRATIRQYDLITNLHFPLIQSPGSAVAMDFHLANGTLIWSDITLQKILMCKIGNDSVNQHLAVKEDCTEDQTILVDSGIQTPDGLAVDWIHDLLFWTDGGLDQVNVMDLKTRKRRTLFSSDLEEPRAIAVDPEMGLIFWTDWGKQARIERAGMDGQHRTVIVTGDRVKWPNGLALDYIGKRVYWADAKVKSIFSSDYWGENIKVVLHSHHYLRHPFSIAVFEDRVYYTDWEHDGVITLNKFTGEDVKKVMNKVATPMTVRIYHQQAQPELENKCSDNDCQELCLPRAVYRGNTKHSEAAWKDRPYACLCHGNTPADALECAVDGTSAARTSSGGYSNRTIFMLFVGSIFILGAALYIHQKKINRPFAPLNFDNPIYRRTVEADMDDPFRDPFRDEAPADANTRNTTSDPEVDIHNSMVQVDSAMDRPLTT